MKNIIESLNWRYATKKFDSEKKINQKEFEDIIEALRLSPSSYGLQPWKFIIVNNKEMRNKIRVAAYDQPQITDASHIIIFANKKNIDDKLVDDYMQFVSREKDIDINNLQGFKGMINGSFSGKTNEELRAWATFQLYLSVGSLLTSCAVLEIDACPMEGFDKSKVDEILGLESLNLESKVIVTLGYRAIDDKSASSKKIRFPKEDVFIEIN
ncbi:MAG: NAD(P)H-dependent oxidoreductase [Candidatus Nomurabacteria bacterium]